MLQVVNLWFAAQIQLYGELQVGERQLWACVSSRLSGSSRTQ